MHPANHTIKESNILVIVPSQEIDLSAFPV